MIGNNKSTISDVLARLTVDINNMNSFMYSLQKMLDSKSDNVTITQKLQDGTIHDINVPSFGYLKSKIDDISNTFETLISANDEVIGIKSSNGDVRKFELKKVSKLIKELEEVSSASLTLPTSFGVKNNWFFESFLNPLLFISIDISDVLTDDIDEFSVKRIIINSIDDDELEYFNTNYLGVNNLNVEEVRLDLEDQGIDYFEDDNIVRMNVPVNRFKGSFDVYRIYEEEIEETIDSTGETVTIYRNRYKLNTLNYTDILDEVDDAKILSEGDVLITDNDSEYKVVSVNKTNTEVVLERLFGIEPITIGADILRMKPERYRAPELQVNVGYNERQIVFIRPISKSNNLTIDDYSNGFGIFTNDLTITLEDDSIATLSDYYTNFVSDFGMMLLSFAKEKKVPAIIAEEPNVPVLNDSNFKVVQVDQHIKEDEDYIEIRKQIAEKENLKVKIKENLKKIDKLKAELNDSQKSQSEKNRIDKKIRSSIREKQSIQTQLGSTVRDITNKLSTTPVFNRSPKYKVRGFWPIPEGREGKYGPQEIVQFKVRYRYLSKKGTAPNAEQTEMVQSDNTKSYAVFSPWTELLTKPRTKILDDITGLYIWNSEDLSNADVVNINQLDIPIRKGEVVEIQVKSISEAGWPDNGVESDWSDSIQIPFPDEIQSSEEATILSQKVFAEEARLDFEDELTARGLDLHLGNQFTTGERFFPHQAKDIASGFFTNEGNIIDLFEKIKNLTNTVESLQQAISLDRGVIKVSIVDDQGNISEVKNGDSVNLFAGYYKDQIKDTSGSTVIYNEGSIITRQYTISIENKSATPLELITLLQGGIEQVVPESDPDAYPDSDYHVNRRYDLVPLSINSGYDNERDGHSFITGYQSLQVKGQFIHSRYLNFGLSNNLYSYYPVTSDSWSSPAISVFNISAFRGPTIPGVPFNGRHYVPFEPGWNGGTIAWDTNEQIWLGSTDGSGNTDGNGYINEFCIHKDHPDIQDLGNNQTYIGSGASSDRAELFAPYNISSGDQSYLLFSHAPFMETSVNEKTGVLGNMFDVQAIASTPSVENSDVNNVTFNHFPIKLGFNPNDEFLIGKYTCGSYLYAFPNSYADISVDGNHPSLSTKKVATGSENSVNIPVLFQYRASDKLGYVGGYRKDSVLKNIKYRKKIGIDIFVKDDVPFSFDIQVECQYKKETTLESPIVPSRGTVPTNFLDTLRRNI